VVTSFRFSDHFRSIGQEGKEEVLGTGMHGAVLVAKHRISGRRVAAKCLEAAETSLPEEVPMS
jgi:hypothetical protein